jgi:hypothetical protein
LRNGKVPGPTLAKKYVLNVRVVMVKSSNHTFDESEEAEVLVLPFNISQHVAGDSFLNLPSHKASSGETRNGVGNLLNLRSL